MSLESQIEGLIAQIRHPSTSLHERSAAERRVRKICEKEGMIYEDLIGADQKPQLYSIAYKGKDQGQILAQVAFKYGEATDVFRRGKKNKIWFECKPQKYLEVQAAWSVLRPAYKREREVFLHAFFNRNRLFSERTKDHPEPTPEEIDIANRAAAMALYMKPAEIHKQLSSGKKA